MPRCFTSKLLRIPSSGPVGAQAGAIKLLDRVGEYQWDPLGSKQPPVIGKRWTLGVLGTIKKFPTSLVPH